MCREGSRRENEKLHSKKLQMAILLYFYYYFMLASAAALNVPSMAAHPSVWRFDDDFYEALSSFFIILIPFFSVCWWQETEWVRVSAVWCLKNLYNIHIISDMLKIFFQCSIVVVDREGLSGLVAHQLGSQQTRSSSSGPHVSLCLPAESKWNTHSTVLSSHATF